MQNFMQKPWFEKHRPTTIDEVVFESKELENKIRGFISDGYIQGNIISYGPGGVGKTTLNKILVTSLIKSQSDFFVLGKSVTDIEDLKGWLNNRPINSKQKIVVCEEFDRLSQQAQNALKNGLMENYMPGVAYIVTTNNIHSIDSALLQRFNEKINFESFDVDGCYFRMRSILEKEDTTYDPDDLYQFVISFKNKGIRELINNMQGATINKVFSSKNSLSISSSGVEDAIISYIKYFYQVIASEQDTDVIYNICLSPTKNATINEYYTPMLKFMSVDPSINYEYILKTLLDDHDILLPLKRIIEKYYQDLKMVPLHNIHMQSCIFETFATLYTIQGGEKKLIH